MKKLSILFLLLVLCVATLFAQAPEKLSYQAVVRNARNQLISNAPMGVRVSILQGGVNGMMVYMETHTAVTNANGLVTLQIGGGTVQQGVFADIDWANGPFFLKTETDPAGGSNYTVTSTQQLLSVPYALYAKEAGNVPQTVGELTNDANYITISDIPEIPTVPTNVSAFFNDAGYITMDSVPTNVSAFANDAGYLTSFTETDPEFNAWDKDYNDLINKPTIPTVPDNVSTFVNDAGYITMDSVPTNVSAFANDAGYLTSFTETDPEFNAWDKDYNDLINKPAIPTVPDNVSAFVNDAGYITMDSVPTNVSAFTNDAGYLMSFTETDPEFNAWDKDYNDLINKPTIPTVPTAISAFANDAGYLTSFTEQQVLSISNDTIFLTGGSFVKLPEGFDGDYNSLTNKPTIPTTVGELTNDANYITLAQVPTQMNADWNATEGAAQILNKPELFSGDYNDLTNKPTIPTVPANVSEFNNDAEYVTTNQLNAANYITAADVPAQVNADWNATEGAAQILNKPELFSGDYNDLTNKPTIPTVPANVSEFNNDANYVTTNQLNAANYITAADVPAQVNADWNATEGAAQILNKPELFSGDYNDLTNKPTIPTVPTNVGAFTNDVGYITAAEVPAVSVPTNVSAFNNDANYITAADVPAQVNADWNATTGAAQILNKPELFSGDYNDLTNKPTIPTVPTNVSEFTNDAGYITAEDIPAIPTVPTDVSAFNNDAGYITGYIETQTLADVTAQGNSAGNRQLKNVSDPTDPQDAVTKTYLDQLVNNLTGLVQNLQQQLDSLQNVVDALTGGGTTITQPTVTTSAATNITSTSATLSGSVSNLDNVAITAQGFEWKATTGGTYTAVNATGETMTYNLTGLTAGTSYTYRAFVTTAEGTSYGEAVSFTTLAAGGGAVIDEKSCPGTPTVTDHEGNVYATVQIGNQCWMRDNLRTTTSPSTGTYLIPPAGTYSSFSGKQAFWYNNNSATYAPMNYGLLYNWNAAVDTFNTLYGETFPDHNYNAAVSVSFTGNRRGICPVGWHLPSDAEWTQLINYVGNQSEYTCGGNSSNIAKALASETGWNSYSINCTVGNDPSTNNATGFSAVPAGRYQGAFEEAGSHAYFWSSTQGGNSSACGRRLNYNNANVHQYNSYDKYAGFSVRCLRD